VATVYLAAVGTVGDPAIGESISSIRSAAARTSQRADQPAYEVLVRVLAGLRRI
jgi:hypothetical protein